MQYLITSTLTLKLTRTIEASSEEEALDLASNAEDIIDLATVYWEGSEDPSVGGWDIDDDQEHVIEKARLVETTTQKVDVDVCPECNSSATTYKTHQQVVSLACVSCEHQWSVNVADIDAADPYFYFVQGD